LFTYESTILFLIFSFYLFVFIMFIFELKTSGDATEATSTAKEVAEQHARCAIEEKKQFPSENLSQLLVGNELPNEFKEITSDITKLLLKINDKKEHLDVEKKHRLDTLGEDCEALLSMYLSYEVEDRVHFEEHLAEGLVGLQTKIESIHYYIIEQGKKRMKHQVEVIHKR
jgi:hypothetical protein